MRVIDAGPNPGHRPPFEVDGGVLVPPADGPARVDAIRAGLAAVPGLYLTEPKLIDPSALSPLHDPGYVAFLRDSCAELAAAGAPALYPSVFPYRPGQHAHLLKARFGEYCFDTYTPLLAGTFDAALRMASAADGAADAVAAGAPAAYALGRPPGHHAERARCGGYSYLNGTALAADRLARLGPVAVLDVDVHHGNGTQHLFYDRPDVLTVSIHGDPAGLFPYFSGYADETGTGRGLGFNRNLPLPPTTDDRGYQPALESALEIIARHRPAFLVVALGFDAHVDDPIGGLALTTDCFGHMATLIRQLAMPTVLVQEGGYGLDVLGSCAAAFVRGFL
jgi:acetoin utilization deacetylase AcuC-like enzyme